MRLSVLFCESASQVASLRASCCPMPIRLVFLLFGWAALEKHAVTWSVRHIDCLGVFAFALQNDVEAIIGVCRVEVARASLNFCVVYL